ncbi:MAG: FecR domain-containing protein [Gemmatimonadaceae bacterium]|nr:FecR domain-containing protein [Gemmatimonadaceae bacterium]
MSDETAGLVPEEGTPVHDAALDSMMARWVAETAEPIDVEAALARVTARRRAEAMPPVDDLAARRATRAREAVRPLPLWQRTPFRVAAALLVVAGAAALWRSTAAPKAEEAYVTATGASKAITLADGTRVRLGPASELRLEPGFGTTHRRLTLHGEGWFEVTHDEAKPFAIHVGTTTVEDVGTAFLVRESASSGVTVRVTEGVVRLTNSALRDSSVTLRAGDGAVATTAGIAVSAGTVSASEGSALKEGRLTFSDASLSEVQESLHRWYGVTLVLADSALVSRHVTADFTGEPLDRVATVLGLTLGARAISHGDTIVLQGAAGAPSRP